MLKNFVQSPFVVTPNPLRVDCYLSFSTPIFHLKIEHYNPNGPLYLYVNFKYTRYSLLSDSNVEITEVDYYFKRIDDYCPSSVIITTMSSNFKKIDIKILISLFKNHRPIAIIEYTFYKDFKPGIYRLNDHFQNFAIYVQVRDVSEKHLGIAESLENEAIYDMSSISNKMRDICVITENNRAVILKPNNRHDEIVGLITGFQAVIFRNGKIIGHRFYAAFECYKETKNYEENVIFIIDGKKFNISFNIIFQKFEGAYSVPEIKKLYLLNPKFEYVENMQLVNKDYKKIFLIRLNIGSKKCPDGSRPILYFSLNHKIYFAEVTTRFNISSSVEFRGKFYRSTLDPCK